MKNTKYYLKNLNRELVKSNVNVLYNSTNDDKARLVIEKTKTAIDYVCGLFECENIFVPNVTIFIYRNLSDMNIAFGRTLPHDQCCFIPIHGKDTLITFTSKISNENLTQIMIHEICHIVFCKVTGNQPKDNFKQSIPLWIDEGLALFLDSKYRLDIKTVISKRLSLFDEDFENKLPKLTEQYTYYNRLDKDTEFGPRGILAYSYSFFCITEIVSLYGMDNFLKFVKNLYMETSVEQLFKHHFGFSIENFDQKMRTKVKQMFKFQDDSINDTLEKINIQLMPRIGPFQGHENAKR